MHTSTQGSGRAAREEKPPMRTTKSLPVRGGVSVEIEAKTVLDGRVIIVCEDVVPPKRLPTDPEPEMIRKGSIGDRHDEGGRGRNVTWHFYPDVYDYLVSRPHIVESIARRVQTLEAHRGTMRWGLQLSWNIRSDMDPMDLHAYTRAMATVEKDLGLVRDERLNKARKGAGRAKHVHDARGRVNGPALGLVIWSADQALKEKVAIEHLIQGKQDIRRWAVVCLLDQLWDFVDRVELTVAEVLDALTPAKRERMTPGRVRRYETDLGQLADDLEHVSIAPFSRRAFPHIARDLRQGLMALRRNTFDDAAKAFDKIRRSIVMTRARRSLEEVRVQANRFREKESAKRIHEADVQGFLDALQTIANTLVANERPIDEDFVNPVIATGVLPMLIRARGAATDEEGYQGERVYQAIKAAAEPL